MDFYNFFSFSAKKAIYRASEICSQFNNQFLEPEHVLYSILNLRSCSAVMVLHQLGINLPKFSYSLEAYLYEHAGSFEGSAVFSQRTIVLLDMAYKEVKRLHHREIGTTHLLTASSLERSPFMRQLFEEHGLDARKIRESFLAHLKGYDHVTDRSSAKETGAQLYSRSTYSFQHMLDDEAEAIFKFARRAAEQFRHPQLLPQHIAFALLLTARSDPEGFFPRAGVHQGHMLAGIIEILNGMPGAAEPLSEQPTESTALLDLITRAFRSALERSSPATRGHQQLRLGARDLLHALLQDPDEQLQQLLQQHGLSPSSMKPLELDVEVSESAPPGAAAGSADWSVPQAAISEIPSELEAELRRRIQALEGTQSAFPSPEAAESAETEDDEDKPAGPA